MGLVPGSSFPYEMVHVQLVLLSSRSIIQPTQQSRYMYEFISKEEEEEEEQGQQEIIIK